MVDISEEIIFKTARSGGSGGQNVNKVETMVTGAWSMANSQLFQDEQKLTLGEKLAGRINKDGFLQLKSQVHRSQLANKEEVILKFNNLVHEALQKKRPRIASKPSKAAKERRIESKKKDGEKKVSRRKQVDHWS